jgi:hypothetical protein
MTSTEWRHLSSLESTIIDQLLAPEFPGKAQLAPQIAGSLVITLDEDGSVKFRVGETTPASEVKYRVPTEGEFQDSDGVTVHVLLHVINGYIDELEIFKENSLPILDWSQASSLRVFAPE